jgi:predicted membrane protein (TIGR00267 family)
MLTRPSARAPNTRIKVRMVKEREFKPHFLMESVAFGLTDGIICFLGIIVGVATATLESRLVLIAGIIGGIADAFGNSIGFFVSQSTERAVQIQMFGAGENHHIHSKREVWMSGVFSFLATIFALVFLLSPFALLGVWNATVASFIVGIVLASLLGLYIGKMERSNVYKSALKYSLITILGATVSFGIGELLHIYI